MKQLTLIRHAKSSWKIQDLEDSWRPLSRRGYWQLLELAAQVPQNAFWLVSPAVRSYSTAHVLRRLAGLPMAGIQLDERLYESRGDKLMSLLQAMGEDVQHLVLVAHSPGLDELASSLCASAPTSLSTGSMLLLSLQIERWADCQAGCGELVMHLAPTE